MIMPSWGWVRVWRIGAAGTLPAVFLLSMSTALADEGQRPLPPGTYRLEMRLGARTAIPLLGTSDTATVSLSRVVIRADGEVLRQTHAVCATRFEGGLSVVRMTMPPRFVASLGEHSYPIDVAWDGAAWTYRADLGVEHVGYHPQQPSAPVPTDAGDPLVVDSDNDGHPGATLHLSIAGLADGELYVAQRGHSILAGRVVAPGRVEGRIDVQVFEQALLGADPRFLSRSPEITLNPSRSTFRLIRVADSTSCATIADAAYEPASAAARLGDRLAEMPPGGGAPSADRATR